MREIPEAGHHVGRQRLADHELDRAIERVRPEDGNRFFDHQYLAMVELKSRRRMPPMVTEAIDRQLAIELATHSLSDTDTVEIPITMTVSEARLWLAGAGVAQPDLDDSNVHPPARPLPLRWLTNAPAEIHDLPERVRLAVAVQMRLHQVYNDPITVSLNASGQADPDKPNFSMIEFPEGLWVVCSLNRSGGNQNIELQNQRTAWLEEYLDTPAGMDVRAAMEHERRHGVRHPKPKLVAGVKGKSGMIILCSGDVLVDLAIPSSLLDGPRLDASTRLLKRIQDADIEVPDAADAIGVDQSTIFSILNGRPGEYTAGEIDALTALVPSRDPGRKYW